MGTNGIEIVVDNDKEPSLIAGKIEKYKLVIKEMKNRKPEDVDGILKYYGKKL